MVDHPRNRQVQATVTFADGVADVVWILVVGAVVAAYQVQMDPENQFNVGVVLVNTGTTLAWRMATLVGTIVFQHTYKGMDFWFVSSQLPWKWTLAPLAWQIFGLYLLCGVYLPVALCAGGLGGSKWSVCST